MNEAIETVANALMRADSASASYHDLARAAIGALRTLPPDVLQSAAVRRHPDGSPFLSDAGAIVWERAVETILA